MCRRRRIIVDESQYILWIYFLLRNDRQIEKQIFFIFFFNFIFIVSMCVLMCVMWFIDVDIIRKEDATLNSTFPLYTDSLDWPVFQRTLSPRLSPRIKHIRFPFFFFFHFAILFLFKVLKVICFYFFFLPALLYILLSSSVFKYTPHVLSLPFHSKEKKKLKYFRVYIPLSRISSVILSLHAHAGFFLLNFMYINKNKNTAHQLIIHFLSLRKQCIWRKWNWKIIIKRKNKKNTEESCWNIFILIIWWW